MKQKTKLAIFHLAFVYSGGGERLVLEEAIELQKLGYEVTIFAPVIDEEHCYPELIRKVNVQRLLPKILPTWFPDLELLSILGACLLIPFLMYKFREYDIYFGANQPGAWIAYVLAKLNRKPYFIYLAQPTRLIHPRLIDQQVGLRIKDGYTALNLMRVVFKPFIHYFDVTSIRNAPVVLANGSYAKGVLETVYGITAINCPAGAQIQKIDKRLVEKRFHGIMKIAGHKLRKPYILLTNRHFPHKKFEFAIQAVRSLGDKKLSLIISGGETAYTTMLKRKYRSKNTVHFLGLLSEKALGRIYENAAVYVYPSPEEDFGMGIVEAMSYGVPPVAWGNAGPTGIITSGENGLLAKPFSVEEYAYHIDHLLSDREFYQKIAGSAYKTVQESFSYLKHAEIIDSCIKKLLTQSS